MTSTEENKKIVNESLSSEIQEKMNEEIEILEKINKSLRNEMVAIKLQFENLEVEKVI